ncbi:MAG: DUF1822 family protein [Xenococcaceae cyanobacterium MO_207.B15]|nr:DUF1822 family protein [Xenococcaceae cyanobacterium MO_207.B15]
MNNAQITPITISLDREAHAKAQHFAAQQTTTQKGKQVYLNTLAVYAVHNYLRWLQIESDLHNSDSWQPGLQSISDTADLFIPNIGRLECRPVLPQQSYLTIPPQATEERIGYVAVQFVENLDRVQLIGFLPAVASSSESQQIPLTKLQSLELLLKKISEPIAIEVTKTEPQITVNLGRWWSKIFEPGWLSLPSLFGKSGLASNLAFRGIAEEQTEETDASILPIRVRRGKLIDLGVRLGNNVVALVVTCTSAAEGEIDILLQVYPGGEQIYLPANLELKVLDETNTLIPELLVKARSADNCIQLFFSGEPGERFSVTLTLDAISFTENFQI